MHIHRLSIVIYIYIHCPVTTCFIDFRNSAVLYWNIYLFMTVISFYLIFAGISYCLYKHFNKHFILLYFSSFLYFSSSLYFLFRILSEVNTVQLMHTRNCDDVECKNCGKTLSECLKTHCMKELIECK